MKYVKTFESFRSVKKINEEFLLGALKGALGKVFGAFGDAFKDMSGDFKKMFNPEDPNSVKQIILSEFNKAIDGAQNKLKDKDVDEAVVTALLTTTADDLVKVANGLDKDVDTAIGKDKSAGAKSIAKSIILGNKEAAWAGIVGLIDPTKGLSGITTDYKYSKAKYDVAIAAAKTLQDKKTTAGKFLDSLQKDISLQLDKEFTEEEVKKAYDEAMAKAKQNVVEGAMNYEKLKVLYDNKTPVKYKMDGYDNNKKPDDQKDKIGTLVMDTLDDKGNVGFKGKDGVAFKKKYTDILPENKEPGHDELITKLKDIKSKNPDNIKVMSDVATALDDPAKADQIKKIITGEAK